MKLISPQPLEVARGVVPSSSVVSLLSPVITFLISTYNRREVLLQTLAKLRNVAEATQIPSQTIVVDNASSDDTAEAVAAAFPDVLLLRERKNRGACAKNVGLPHAVGQIIVFLDDDSFPSADSIAPLIEHFKAHPALGAVVFDIILPDGSRESSAYPTVFIGCGTAFRREALRRAGGLPDDFFMQAEEYDLSLRLMENGWEIRRFNDLRVYHQKTPGARQPIRTTRLDARNNLMLITRYFPRRWIIPFALDWMRRYQWIARSKGRRHQWAFWVGLGQGVWRSLWPRHRRPVSSRTLERFAMIDHIESRLRAAIEHTSIRSVVLIDVGKNILPFWLAARRCGIRIVVIADPRLARPNRRYRGVPIVDDAAALALDFDAAVLTNLSPAHASMRRQAWQARDHRQVIDVLESQVETALIAGYEF